MSLPSYQMTDAPRNTPIGIGSYGPTYDNLFPYLDCISINSDAYFLDGIPFTPGATPVETIIDMTFVGISEPVVVPVTLYQIGNLVHINIPLTQPVFTAPGIMQTSENGPYIPLSFVSFPLRPQNVPIWVQNANNTSLMGSMSFTMNESSTGYIINIGLGPDLENFNGTPGNQAGFFNIDATWLSG